MAATISAAALCSATPTIASAKDAPPAVPALGNSAEGTADITVAARRRSEDLEKVPLAISVVGGALLERSYTVNTNQLSLLVPALNYSSANPRNTAFTIRGLGSSVVAVSQANDGLEPGVGFYVDQVYHARPATAAFDFSDIEQIEVLRGPQGTLFGKNTTAGAISITSQAPTFSPEASEALSVGSYNFVQAKASASGPLIGDTLAFRIAGLTTRRDGVIDNVRTGAKQNGIGNQAVRGQLLFKPTSDFQLRLSADFTNFESECCTQVYLRVGQSLRAATRQYAGPTGLAAQFGYAPPSTNPYDRKTDIDAQLGVSTNEGGVSAIADWNLGKIGTLTSVSAWRFWNWDAANDRDYTGIPVQITQHIPSRQDQFSQELRLASNGEHRLGYVAGLYFFDQKITGEPISIYGPAAARYLIGTTTGTGAAAVAVPANLLDGYGTDGNTRLKEDSYAAFAELNYKLLPRLTLTGGLRYTYEVKDGSYSAYTFGGPTVTNAALLAAQLGVLRGQSYSGHDTESNLSGRANLAWQATDQVLAYASYARGFKSGGINLSGLPLDIANQPVLTTAVIRPELNTTYEAGLKAALFERRLTFNLAGFTTAVRDFQATIVDSAQTVALRGYLSNIPKVTVKGVEADVTATLTPRFQLRGNLAYAHGQYSRYPAGPCPLELQTAATAACNLTGRPLAGLPKWSETIGGDYTLPVGTLAVILHADSSWRTSYYGDPSLSKYTLIDGYTVTNASLAVRTRSGLEVAVFVRNVFNADYIQNLTIQAGNSGLILGTPSDPRVIGVTLRTHQ